MLHKNCIHTVKYLIIDNSIDFFTNVTPSVPSTTTSKVVLGDTKMIIWLWNNIIISLNPSIKNIYGNPVFNYMLDKVVHQKLFPKEFLRRCKFRWVCFRILQKRRKLLHQTREEGFMVMQEVLIFMSSFFYFLV